MSQTPHGVPEPVPYGAPVPYVRTVDRPVPRALLSPLPAQPVPYHQMLRTPRSRWWEGLLMIVTFVASYLVLSLVLQIGAVLIDVARGRVELADLLAGRLTLTPVLLLAVNVTNALCIPVSMLLQRAFFGQRGRWLHSVEGRFRWRVVGRAALLVAPIWAAYAAVTVVLSLGAAKPLTAESWVLLAIVVLTTPLQAAGEEYGARGLIARGAGMWAASPVVALAVSTGVSAVIFMLAHGAGDPWLIVTYFAFGVGWSLITWRTGGIEVSVMLHTLNNLVAFSTAILLGQDLNLDRSNGTGGPVVLFPLTALALSLAVLWWWAGRSGLRRTYEPGQDELVRRQDPPARGDVTTSAPDVNGSLDA